MKRLNWVDILIIIVLVGALAFLGVRAVINSAEKRNQENSEVVAETNPLSDPTITMIVEIPEISRELAENAMASLDDAPRPLDGDMVPMTRLYNSNRLADGQIVSWEILDTEDESIVCLRITIDANPSVYRCNYTVGTQEVRVGKGFIVKTMSMELTGTIVSLVELGDGPMAELEDE